jgi:hypothetical protein
MTTEWDAANYLREKIAKFDEDGEELERRRAGLNSKE